MILIASQLFLYFFFIPTFSSADDTFSVDYTFSACNNTLAGNQSLSGYETLVSLNGNFEMGIFGEFSNYNIGIWYATVKKSKVWVANRETPFSDITSSKLKIKDGNLVFSDGSNNQIWSTNVSSSATPVSLALLDDGNLVLRSGSNSSPPIWQSFDHPTHAFLPGMKLGYNKRTNTKWILASWKSERNPAAGLFSFEVDHNQKQFVLKWNRSVRYWTGVTESWFDYCCNLTYIDNENESYYTYSLCDTSSISRFIIDVSGQFKQLSLVDDILPWNLSAHQPSDLCDVYGVCGAFGVCNQWMKQSCNCLTDFKPRSPYDWWILDSFSGGCVRENELNCSMIKKPEFILSYVKRSIISAVPKNAALKLNKSACRRSCLDDYICNAYTFLSNVCLHWGREDLDSISLEFVSNISSVHKAQIHIKVASKDLPHRAKNKVNRGVVAGSVAGLVLVLGVILLITHRKKKISDGRTKMEGCLVAFVYRDIKKATTNFSDKLGGGGFGSVFKGVLNDSSSVAVKKLESVSQGEKEFRSIVSTLGCGSVLFKHDGKHE